MPFKYQDKEKQLKNIIMHKSHHNDTTSISKKETSNIWEHLWWTHENETTSLSKQEPLTIWEHLWQINQNETTSISKQNPRSIWEQLLPIHKNETTNISKQETYIKLGSAWYNQEVRAQYTLNPLVQYPNGLKFNMFNPIMGISCLV